VHSGKGTSSGTVSYLLTSRGKRKGPTPKRKRQSKNSSPPQLRLEGLLDQKMPAFTKFPRWRFKARLAGMGTYSTRQESREPAPSLFPLSKRRTTSFSTKRRRKHNSQAGRPKPTWREDSPFPEKGRQPLRKNQLNSSPKDAGWGRDNLAWYYQKCK